MTMNNLLFFKNEITIKALKLILNLQKLLCKNYLEIVWYKIHNVVLDNQSLKSRK